MMANLSGAIAVKILFLSGEIREVEMEEYLKGVIPSEMPSSWEFQALCAQAVAARSYALYAKRVAPRHGEADLCTTTHCQVYIPGVRIPPIEFALRKTCGIYLCDRNGVVMETQYVSKCGREVCPYCAGSHGYGGKTWSGRMCQYGAQLAAQSGYSWREILYLYYSDFGFGQLGWGRDV